MRLSGSVVLVTGATGGIGGAAAVALRGAGARVVLSGRDAERLDALAHDLDVSACVADLTEPGAPERLAKTAADVYGHVDALVDCAGRGWWGPFEQMTPSAIEDMVALNVTAPLLLARALLPAIRARHVGHLAFLSSIAGWTGVANESAYSGSKAAVAVFGESLRGELSGSGVGVSVVSPAAVRTEFFDRRGAGYERRVPRPVSPDRVAATIVEAIEHDVPHRMVPAWLALAPAVRATVPAAYRRLTDRFGGSADARTGPS